jgi:hypothetical protein
MKTSCCGRKCGECVHYPSACLGCDEEDGRIFWLQYVDEVICPIRNCCCNKYELSDCGLCPNHPCARYDDNHIRDYTEPAARLLSSPSTDLLAAELQLPTERDNTILEPSIIHPTESPTSEILGELIY